MTFQKKTSFPGFPWPEKSRKYRNPTDTRKVEIDI